MTDDPRECPKDAAKKEALSRRGLLDVVLGAGFVAWATSIAYPVLRYLSPLEEAGGADEVELGDAQKKAVATAGFAIVPLGTERVLVFKDRTEKIRALSAKCTHEGCTVQFKPEDALIWCACHNGKFDLDGRVISGPPPRALAAYRVSGSPATKLVVSKGEEA